METLSPIERIRYEGLPVTLLTQLPLWLFTFGTSNVVFDFLRLPDWIGWMALWLALLVLVYLGLRWELDASLLVIVILPIALMLLIAAAAYRRRNQLGVGAALAIALLLKNEGLLIALAFYSVWIIKDREIPWRAIAITSVSLALLLVYKQWVGVGNDVMSSTGMLDRIGDWYRYAVVLVAGVVALVMFGTGALPVLLLGVGLERHKVQVDVPLIACGVILLGYWAIYIITPHDLAWHIQSSYDRLLLHLFPAAAYSLPQ